jgi:hypothetical protein
MKTYNVTIKAEVYKTITVNATDEDSAYIAAHELFTVAPDFVWPESYNEETINIEQTGDQTMRTADLTGAALDWAVAKCERVVNGGDLDVGFITERGYTPSTDWAQGGAIIEQEKIAITGTNFPWWECDSGWYAHIGDCYSHGTTPLIAAMRCYVASKLGTEVEVPEELLSCADE